MIKILTSEQVRAADRYTIEHEPIASIDLMERASTAFVTKFMGLHPEKKAVRIFCGTGNNGGDGLAIGRLLRANGWVVALYVVGDPDKGSADFKTNFDRVEDVQTIHSAADFPSCHSQDILIDGLFGSGLSRPIQGLHTELVNYLNNQKCQRIAIDIASGLYADKPVPANSVVFQPHYTFTFQTPKLAFFQPENHAFVGEFRILPIGLDDQFISDQSTSFYYTEADDVRNLLPTREKFAHKNKVGRLLIIAGSKGKMGAALLCTKAAFKTGVGLVNVHVPKCGVQIVQVAVPEAMAVEDTGSDYCESIEASEDTIAIGPGLGIRAATLKSFESFIKATTAPLVIDADALNLLAENDHLLKHLPEDSILTPHPGEFKRLVGSWKNDFEKLDKLRSFCRQLKVHVVLKGAYSAVCNSSGDVFFNSTGNPSMATAGSGDVLTGVIGSFLAQGLQPFDALRLGVYLHGLAGDEAVLQLESEWIQATDIVDHLRLAAASLSC